MSQNHVLRLILVTKFWVLLFACLSIYYDGHFLDNGLLLALSGSPQKGDGRTIMSNGFLFFQQARVRDTGLRLYIHPAVGNHPPLICWYSVNRSGPRLGQGASLVAQTVKNLPRCQRCGFDPWVGKIPWRRKWQPTPVFLSGESCGQRSLEGYTVHGVAKSQTRLQ